MLKIDNYKAVILDFDGTLSDFQLAKSNAKQIITPYLTDKGVNVDEYWKHYENIFEPLFSRYINHELSVNEYRLMRFIHHGVTEKEAAVYNEIYLNEVHKPILFKDVIPFLKEIKSRGLKAFILTNGPESQREKIEGCKVNPYIDRIFISCEMGFGKPDLNAYRYLLKETNINPQNVLMIGDNYANDCEAAEKVNISSVQIIRNDEPQQHKNVIHSLSELL